MAVALNNLPKRSSAVDADIVQQVCAGDTAQFAVIIRRYNQRLYRIARSITGDESEAEDVTQQTFLSAFQHLDQFAGRAEFSSWLTRIAVNESFARARKKKRFALLADVEQIPEDADLYRNTASSPENNVMRREASAILEAALDKLAERHRTVFVLRDVEELSTAETAAVLEITDEAVRTRLHRARAALRELLLDHFGLAPTDVFPFAGLRCDRIVAGVFAVLEKSAVSSER